jgi:hypothetical protein
MFNQTLNQSQFYKCIDMSTAAAAAAAAAVKKPTKAAANTALYVFKGALSKVRNCSRMRSSTVRSCICECGPNEQEIGITVTVSAAVTNASTAKLVVEASTVPTADELSRVLAAANAKLLENVPVTFDDLDKTEVGLRRR